jgi:protease-4
MRLPGVLNRKLSKSTLFFAAIFLIVLIAGCGTPKIFLFVDETEPLQEYTLQGKKKEKVLLLPINGVISDARKTGLLQPKPSLLQEVVSQLRKASRDDKIKAVLLKINSPGGTTTASDILYHELMMFKQKTGKKIVVAMMDMATSGGYYISLPADHIVAHPTTVTGSVGVIFMRPELQGLMEKIGVGYGVTKTGKNKDMASWFRKITPEEEQLLQNLIDNMGDRFLGLVQKHRQLDAAVMADVASARVFVAEEAAEAGLIDEIGYLDTALAQAKKIAGIPTDSQLVVYRRSFYPDDNQYNTTTLNQASGSGTSLIDLGVLQSAVNLPTGFYYIWPPAAAGQ